MEKKKRNILLFLITGIILGILLYNFNPFQQSIVSEEEKSAPELINVGYISAPVFATLECLPNQLNKIDTEFINQKQTPHNFKDGKKTIYYLSCDDYGENKGCEVQLKTPKESFITLPKVLLYNKCDNLNCQLNQKKELFSAKEEIIEIPLDKGEFLLFGYYTSSLTLGTEDRDGMQFRVKMIPYSLVLTDILKGGKNRLKDSVNNCVMPGTQKKGIITFSTIKELSGNKQVPQSIQPDEFFNFVTGFVAIDKFSTGTNKENAYCSNTNNGAKLFNIEKVAFGNKEYNVVNTDYNKALPDKIDCCNGYAEKGFICENNKLIKAEEQSECSEIKPCSGSNSYFIDNTKSNTVLTYMCVENKCVKDEQKVECAQSSDCKNGQICKIGYEPKLNKCINIDPNPVGKVQIPGTEKETPLYFYILVIILISGIIYLLFKKPTNKKKKIN